MILSVDQTCSIFFGNSATCPIGHKNERFGEFCDVLRQQLQLKHFVVQHQVHGINGQIITSSEVFAQPTIVRVDEGDFLITTQPDIGISVITADCLPIIFYDQKKQIVGAAHAGWKGSLAGIGQVVIKNFIELGSKPENIRIYFGAAAQSCCYEVQKDFLKPAVSLFIIQRNNKYFFDNTNFNKHLLQTSGILEENIDITQHLCTICNHNYHSYRRAINKTNYDNQLTTVWLKK